MTNAPVKSLVSATIAFLERRPPFDVMERDALQFLAARLSLGYHPRGATILSPEHGEPQTFFIIQRGVVELGQNYACQVPNGPAITLGPGEYFSIGALLENRPVTVPYTAAGDTFCYQLSAADFRELLHRSPRFQDFSTRYLGSLLRESRRLLKMNFSSIASEQQSMNSTLRSLIRRPPVTCAPGTPVGEALRTMQQEKVGSIIGVSPQGAPLGILSRYDVLDRVALAQCDLAQPVVSIMTPDPITLRAEASAYDAALTMARHGVRHIPVVDDGRVIGIVTERDLFTLQRTSMRQINEIIVAATSGEDLQHAARGIRQLAHNLLEHGVAAEQLMLIISTLNDALTKRIIELEQVRHALAGIDWCWLAFGSEGRYEQTISTDQDNGLIFMDNQHRPLEQARALLLPFAQAVNRTLDACGFPLCKGDIMAGNPRWCLTLGEWQEQFGSWIRDTEPEALMNAAIFFDIRPLCGKRELADTLREQLRTLTHNDARFLRQMAQEALRARPPLGMLRDFVTDDSGEFAHALDLKKSGARLFVDAARVFGLTAGTSHTGTAQRLREAAVRLNIGDEEVSAVVEAFFFIQMLRLRAQITPDQAHPGRAHNRIDPYKLNEVDRLILKESFRQARKLQTRLALDYQL
jgi:CBS domain-containing protein